MFHVKQNTHVLRTFDSNSDRISNSLMKIGSIGEMLTAKHYQNLGFTLVRMNYSKKFGEVDLIVRKEDVTHFVEVKSVECVSKHVVFERYRSGVFKPELRVDMEKKLRLQKVIDDWVRIQKYDGVIQFDVAAVYVVSAEKIGYVKIFENVEV